MLQQNTCTQKSTSFGLDGRKQAILEEICIRYTGHSVPLGMNCSKITPRSSQKRVSITFPTGGCVRIFFSVLVRSYGAIPYSLS